MDRRRRLIVRLRYLAVLSSRFKVTLTLGAVLFLGTPPIYAALYVGPDGQRIGMLHALHHVYFLLFGEPSLPYVDSLAIEVMNLAIPPLGLAVVVDGIVRFAYLYFAKHRDDKEWVAVMSQTYRNHVIVCGAGRVGYRVAQQLIELGKDVVVIEKDEHAPFVSALRDQQVPVLIDSCTHPKALERTNVRAAAAIVCATNDDLANLNIALDARRVNPEIRVVLRLFDEDLGQRVRENFRAEAMSTSAVSATSLALSALDPRIVHSFHVGPHLMVVSQFLANDKLSQLSLGELRSRFGGHTLAMAEPGGSEQLHPPDAHRIEPGQVLTVQCRYDEYLELREFTGEAKPPLSARSV